MLMQRDYLMSPHHFWLNKAYCECRSHPYVMTVCPPSSPKRMPLNLTPDQRCSEPTHISPAGCVCSAGTFLPTSSLALLCLPAVIAHQPVVQLTGFNGGRREEGAQQEQRQRGRRQARFRHPPASSCGASHPARPIYRIAFKASETSIPRPVRGEPEGGLVVPEMRLSGSCELQQKRQQRRRNNSRRRRRRETKRRRD